METLEKAIDAQYEITDRLKSFMSNYKKTPLERLTVGYITSRMTGLNKIWDEFVATHKVICSKTEEKNKKDIEYFTQSVYDKYEDSYYDLCGRMSDKLASLQLPNLQPDAVSQLNPSIPPPINPTRQANSHIHIPPLNVPSFTGKYEDWTSFNDLFVAAVDSNPTLQPVHKLQYLKSLLKGEAEGLIKHTSITNENYAVALQILRDRFDNKRAIINCCLKRLLSQRNAEETATSIRLLLDNTMECINTLRLQDIDTTAWDCILVFIITQRIPTKSLDLWEQSLERNTLPTFKDLVQFLENRFRSLEFAPRQVGVTHDYPPRQKKQSFLTKSGNCRFCNGPQHRIRTCSKFLEMRPAERLQAVNNAKLCKNCFAYSHKTSECPSSAVCNICKLKHNSLLHLPTNTSSPSNKSIAPQSAVFHASSNHPSNSVESTSTTQQGQSSNPLNSATERPISVTSMSSRQAYIAAKSTISDNQIKVENVLATALVTVKAFDGNKYIFRALLDNASQENFVSKRVLHFLGRKAKPTFTTISGIGQSNAPKPIGEITFTFGSTKDSNCSTTLNAIVLPNLTYNLPSRTLLVDQSLTSGLELADPTYGTPGRIDMLLSANIFAQLTLPSIRKSIHSSTIALHTKLGWVLYGEANSNITTTQQRCFHIITDPVGENISKSLQRFWTIEEAEVKPCKSPEDEKCEKIYSETVTREPNGRYKVHLPFKTQEPPLFGASRDRAVSRLLQMERKLSQNQPLQIEYAQCLNEYIQLGHMKLVNTTEDQHKVSLPDGSFAYSCYYLPHHAVIKLDSTTTKVRVVFDASSKTLNGKSLNDQLLIGPSIQDSLVNLLIRWRKHQVVIKADITKMYRQILVQEKHRSYQRIVWRTDPTSPIKDYELQTVTFGTASAPYLAIKTIHRIAADEQMKYPVGAEALKNDFYVDDLLTGADSIREALVKQKQIIEILRLGGFDIRKWSSNKTLMTSGLDPTERELCPGSDSSLKTLGILWCPLQDTLSIKVAALPSKVNSKRLLLSEIAKLFDPLGLIAPIIIKMKILMQQLWLTGLNWDEPLPDAIMVEWNEFQQQLPSIEQIKIQRWFNMSSNSEYELHGFCDASERAYAAVIYIRVQLTDKTFATHLIASKTKVAPVKQISLPRLELCAATLLAKLMTNINTLLTTKSIFAWTDSEIVLAWLQHHPSHWKTFIANRVSEIQSTLEATAWNHVSSKDNPADCASRGILPNQLLDHPLWWHGPKWLSLEKTDWKNSPKSLVKATQLEIKKSQTFLIVPTNDSLNIILSNCSTLGKALRVMAYVRRWSLKHTKRGSPLSTSEIFDAKKYLIRYSQQIHFADEYTDLLNKKPLSKKSKLLSLNPFIDLDSIIRVGGRLKNANIPFPIRHPIILPKSARLTELTIDSAHKSTMHGGVSLMLSHLRNEYWIIDSRNTLRRHVHKCNTCYRFSNPSLNQLMGNLPSPRINISLPFTHTGVDYAGPISIRLRRCPGRQITTKGYICLFICLATKAVHLELVGDMSAATFLSSLSRFIARRGLPTNMYSDNGTYFVRAAQDINADLKSVIKNHTKEAIKVHHSIDWHFIPPSAPHFGGIWEAGIKSTKYHLKRTVGDGSLTFEELTTTLCQIEACLNSRPLCPITNDPEDLQVITPGHFLIGRPLLARPQPSVLEIPHNRLHYWQQIYKTTERFWHQWQAEYLSRLQQRPKWLTQQENICLNDLVLLKEDNLPPTQWRLARILEIFPGKDGLIRVVTLKTESTTLKRPITKICRLPTQ